MRCQTLRSVLRGFLAAGILASAQSAPLDASWKDRLQPYAASCFVHDIHWDTPYFANRVAAAKLTPQVIAEDEAIARENELCLAAAKNFELRSQFQAAWETINATKNSFARFGQRLFRDTIFAREQLITSLDHGALKLVQWIQVPQSLPVTALVSQDDTRFDDEWYCGDWAHAVANQNSVPAIRLPERNGGNIFVYAIEAAREVAFDDSASLDSLCNDPAKEPIAQTNTWQVGIDPVCPELHHRNAPVSWRDSFIHSSVCCPLQSDEEAIAIQSHSHAMVMAERPPVLEAEAEMVAANEFSLCETEMRSIQSSDVASSPYAIEEQYERRSRINSIDAARIIDSIGASDWSGWMASRIDYRRLPLTIPQVQTPHALFSLEDLILPSKARAWITDTFQNSLKPIMVDVQRPTAARSTIATDYSADIFSSGSGIVSGQSDVVASQERVVPSSMVSSQAVSKYVANRIRNFGLLLLDFASQMEMQADQVEIARQESHQR